MPKGDAFERMVSKALVDSTLMTNCLTPFEVVKLLRAQHRATVRMVQKMIDNNSPPTSDIGDGYVSACADILFKLNARGK